MSERVAQLKGVLDQTVAAHNRTMAMYQESDVADRTTSGREPDETQISMDILDAAADLNAAYTKIGAMILRLDPDALD